VSQQAKGEIDSLVEKDVDSVDTDIRYFAYGARLRTALRAAHRYVAYTSDVGEAFRPIVPPRIVSAAYGVSWVYLAGDVGYEGYKAYKKGPSPVEAANFSESTRIGMLVVKRAVFQSVASMALPAFTIHTAVRCSKPLFKSVQNPRLKLWGPTVTGLSLVPGLPFVFDHPVERATDVVFEWMEKQLIERNNTEKSSRDEPSQRA